jgi:hypothetical protein
VLVVRVYDRSGDLPVAMLMHASLIAGTLFVLLPAATGVHLAIYYAILASALWAVVAVVDVAVGEHRARRPLRTQAARMT